MSNMTLWKEFSYIQTLFIIGSIINFRYSKFETSIWAITDTICQIWAKSAKLSFFTVGKLKNLNSHPP